VPPRIGFAAGPIFDLSGRTGLVARRKSEVADGFGQNMSGGLTASKQAIGFAPSALKRMKMLFDK
jgi:hypothetical protein